MADVADEELGMTILIQWLESQSMESHLLTKLRNLIVNLLCSERPIVETVMVLSPTNMAKFQERR